jgi:hypothetical protein
MRLGRAGGGFGDKSNFYESRKCIVQFGSLSESRVSNAFDKIVVGVDFPDKPSSWKGGAYRAGPT